MNSVDFVTNGQPTLKSVRGRADVSQIDENALIERCKQNDKEAWDLLISRYYNVMFRFAYSLCRNHEDASDIVAQVMVLLYKRIETFRADASFASWLFRIIRNVYVDLCVRASGRNNLSLDDPLVLEGGELCSEVLDNAPTPEETIISDERSQVLRREISFLPKYQREVMMHHADGKSHEEIAILTGLSQGTIKSRLSRARESLRQRLSPMQDLFAA